MYRIDFIGRARLWMSISLALVVVGIASMVVGMATGRGALNFGIDFTGGTILDLKFEQPVDLGRVRNVVLGQGLGEAVIQQDQTDPRVVLIRTRSLTPEARDALLGALEKDLGRHTVLRVEDVHGVIARNLIMQAVLAVLIALVGILIYLAFRFEHRFGVAAVLALFHDAIIVLGAFALFRVEVGAPFVAAVLTIVGYSVMDTVVVFDRIRENLKLKQRGQSFADVANLSINQVVGRSIKTSLTVFFAVMAVLLFGGKTTRDFALALAIGVISGTYSSIFIASPIWVWWREREERARRRAAEPTRLRPAEGGRLRPAPATRPASAGGWPAEGTRQAVAGGRPAAGKKRGGKRKRKKR
ncbi:MAG: protein translocase subunit SecF [Bacillota bacterium]